MGSKDGLRDLARAMAAAMSNARDATHLNISQIPDTGQVANTPWCDLGYTPSLNGWKVDFDRMAVWIESDLTVPIMRVSNECDSLAHYPSGWYPVGVQAKTAVWLWESPGLKDLLVSPLRPDGVAIEKEYMKWIHEKVFEKP